MKKTLYALSLMVVAGFSAFTLSKSIAVAQAASTQCIVTIFGIQYDVSPLQTGHPGGNVFVCGTDMTAVYSGQHGTDVSRMTSYLLPTATATPTASPTVSPTITPTETPVPSVSPTVSPTITGVPSISPSPSIKNCKENDDEKENENNEDHKNDRHENENHKKEKNRERRDN